MKKLQTAQSHVYTAMDKLGPVKEALVSKDDDWEEWDLEQLVDNLRKYVDRHLVAAEPTSANRRFPESKEEFKRRDRGLMANSSQKNLRTFCVYCGKNNHRSSDCFKVLDVAHRKEILKSKNLCFNCANTGHVAAKCRSRGCITCGG